MSIDISPVNFHTKINTPEYFSNQRLFATILYISQAEEKGYDIEICKRRIEMYFGYLDNYPEYVAVNEKRNNEFTQRTGYKSPITEDKNLDHTWASRMTGLSSQYVLDCFKGYYLRSDASITQKSDWEKEQDKLDWEFR